MTGPDRDSADREMLARIMRLRTGPFVAAVVRIRAAVEAARSAGAAEFTLSEFSSLLEPVPLADAEGLLEWLDTIAGILADRDAREAKEDDPQERQRAGDVAAEMERMQEPGYYERTQREQAERAQAAQEATAERLAEQWSKDQE